MGTLCTNGKDSHQDSMWRDIKKKVHQKMG